MIDWPSLVQGDPGGRFAFNSYEIVFEMELFLHSFGEAGSRFLNEVVCEK